MAKYSNIAYLVLMLCLSVTVDSKPRNTKDSIAFPEIEENINLVNKNDRRPVFLPSMCPENELFYPGDQKDDWICDCRPGYIFHPKTDACWPAYQRGPCDHGSYLILVPNSVIPECVRNPCVSDQMVIFNGKCEKLGATAPCGVTFPIKAVFVNATTLDIECTNVNTESPFNQKIVEEPLKSCPPGCKRVIQNKC
ncbi:uncharacterized protein LOC121725993 [Aricia agestis]|uniref:uncharacterized protein LOC121725993 n=1 Tax=Aricia agestis TaxID=91739 RepID=UPI001C2055BF|nr:uncharacterized protein LOC121725993 [Aricia agestis]